MCSQVSGHADQKRQASKAEKKSTMSEEEQVMNLSNWPFLNAGCERRMR